MDERISSVRSWIDRPLTLADKLLLGHLENSDQIQINPGETYVHLKPDRVALQDVLGEKVIKLWHKDSSFKNIDFIILPGGFSYGDYLRSGAIAAKSNILTEVIQAGKKGSYVEQLP